MPQLEILRITFHSPFPNSDVERQLLVTPIMTHVTLANLRWFCVWACQCLFGSGSSLDDHPPSREARDRVLEPAHVFCPMLPAVHAHRREENLKFSSARLKSDADKVTVFVYPRRATSAHTFCMQVDGKRFDEQVSSVAQIFEGLSPVFYEVERLTITLLYKSHDKWSLWHYETDRSQWRKLLRSFNNVQTLVVDGEDGLVIDSGLARSLRLDGGPPLELLPKLKELTCHLDIDPDGPFTPEMVHPGCPFTSFIDARRNCRPPCSPGP
ncbi:hypothetical protein BJV74DRAFT_65433 [Russula compacta]|nr:hypothetical protein BJV74DRAFT_65433 [Russula compacta]